MIFGNPDEFAIHCDIVEAWNDDFFWKNGIYSIYIKGDMYPKNLYATELKFNLANMTTEIINNLEKNIPIKISSSDMEDEGVDIYYFYNDNFDFISIKTSENEKNIAYPKKYIADILIKLSLWKTSFLKI